MLPNKYPMPYKRKKDARARCQRYYYAHHRAIREQQRHYKLRLRYGLSAAEYAQLEFAAAGHCVLCGQPPPPKTELHVDHDHRTGRVRALLCIRCNLDVGVYERRAPAIRAYLRRFSFSTRSNAQ